MSSCSAHADHAHTHGPDCEHASVEHDGHRDYFHDGHVHREHDGHWDECTRKLRSLFQHHPLPGNWRDLQRLADNLLLTLAAARDGNPPSLSWHTDQLEHAIGDTFGEL